VVSTLVIRISHLTGIARVISSLYTAHTSTPLSLYLFPNTNTMSSSSSSAPNPNSIRDQQMLAVGRQCSHQSCHLVDFLPFKCQHCANSYCADHFKPASHSCPKYDEAKFNRVAPDCEHRSCTIPYRPVYIILLPRPSLQRTCSHPARRGPQSKDGTPP